MNFLRLYIPLKGHKQRVSTQVYILTLCTTLETCVKQYGEAKHWPSRGSVLFIGGRKFRGSINFMWGAFTPIITETNHIFFTLLRPNSIYTFLWSFFIYSFQRDFLSSCPLPCVTNFFGDLRIIITRCWTSNIYDHYAMAKCLRLVTQ